jgi:hypothetical protein
VSGRRVGHTRPPSVRCPACSPSGPLLCTAGAVGRRALILRPDARRQRHGASPRTSVDRRSRDEPTAGTTLIDQKVAGADRGHGRPGVGKMTIIPQIGLRATPLRRREVVHGSSGGPFPHCPPGGTRRARARTLGGAGGYARATLTRPPTEARGAVRSGGEKSGCSVCTWLIGPGFIRYGLDQSRCTRVLRVMPHPPCPGH